MVPNKTGIGHHPSLNYRLTASASPAIQTSQTGKTVAPPHRFPAFDIRENQAFWRVFACLRQFQNREYKAKYQ